MFQSRTFQHIPTETLSLAWSHGNRIATGGIDRNVRVWDPNDGTNQVLAGHDDWVRRVTWSRHNQLATCDDSGKVILWNKDAVVGELTVKADYLQLTWSPNGTTLAIGSRCTIHLWETVTKSTSRHELSCIIRDIVWSPFWIAIVSQNAVQLWDHTMAERRDLVSPSDGAIRTIAWSNLGSYLAAVKDRTVTVWNSAGNLHCMLKSERYLKNMVWAPIETSLACGTYDGTILVWWTLQTEPVELKNISTPVQHIAWSASGRFLAAVSGPCMHLWDLHTGNPVHSVTLTNIITAIAWSLDRDQIASICDDGVLSITTPT